MSAAAGSSGNEVDDTIRELRSIPGFSSYVILNSDGIVIKYEKMSYRTALHHAYLALNLHSKATKHVRELFRPVNGENEMESMRLVTRTYEMIIAQRGNFMMVVTQSKIPDAPVAAPKEEKKEGTEEKKEA